jgi:hypothetical protein
VTPSCLCSAEPHVLSSHPSYHFVHHTRRLDTSLYSRVEYKASRATRRGLAALDNSSSHRASRPAAPRSTSRKSNTPIALLSHSRLSRATRHQLSPTGRDVFLVRRRTSWRCPAGGQSGTLWNNRIWNCDRSIPTDGSRR